MTERERNLIRDAMMFAVKDITGRVLCEATVQSMIDDFEKAINYSRCSTQLPDKDKKQLIEDAYWLNLQNLSGREDFEEAFRLGIETGVDETLEKLQG